jgi:phage-related protein
MKDAIFHPATLAAVQSFPQAVRREFGKLLYDLQMGIRLGMPTSRPMQSVGKGVHELRLRDRSGIYRALPHSRCSRHSGFSRVRQKNTDDVRARSRIGPQAPQGDAR